MEKKILNCFFILWIKKKTKLQNIGITIFNIDIKYEIFSIYSLKLQVMIVNNNRIYKFNETFKQLIINL